MAHQALAAREVFEGCGLDTPTHTTMLMLTVRLPQTLRLPSPAGGSNRMLAVAPPDR